MPTAIAPSSTRTSSDTDADELAVNTHRGLFPESWLRARHRWRGVPGVQPADGRGGQPAGRQHLCHLCLPQDIPVRVMNDEVGAQGRRSISEFEQDNFIRHRRLPARSANWRSTGRRSGRCCSSQQHDRPRLGELPTEAAPTALPEISHQLPNTVRSRRRLDFVWPEARAKDYCISTAARFSPSCTSLVRLTNRLRTLARATGSATNLDDETGNQTTDASATMRKSADSSVTTGENRPE